MFLLNNTIFNYWKNSWKIDQFVRCIARGDKLKSNLKKISTSYYFLKIPRFFCNEKVTLCHWEAVISFRSFCRLTLKRKIFSTKSCVFWCSQTQNGFKRVVIKQYSTKVFMFSWLHYRREKPFTFFFKISLITLLTSIKRFKVFSQIFHAEELTLYWKQFLRTNIRVVG